MKLLTGLLSLWLNLEQRRRVASPKHSFKILESVLISNLKVLFISHYDNLYEDFVFSIYVGNKADKEGKCAKECSCFSSSASEKDYKDGE